MPFIHYSDPTMTRDEIVANNRREGAKNAAETRARNKLIHSYFAKFGAFSEMNISPKMLEAMARSLETGKDRLAKLRTVK